MKLITKQKQHNNNNHFTRHEKSSVKWRGIGLTWSGDDKIRQMKSRKDGRKNQPRSPFRSDDAKPKITAKQMSTEVVLTAQMWLLIGIVAAVILSVTSPSLQNTSAISTFKCSWIAWFICMVWVWGQRVVCMCVSTMHCKWPSGQYGWWDDMHGTDGEKEREKNGEKTTRQTLWIFNLNQQHFFGCQRGWCFNYYILIGFGDGWCFWYETLPHFSHSSLFAVSVSCRPNLFYFFVIRRARP